MLLTNRIGPVKYVPDGTMTVPPPALVLGSARRPPRRDQVGVPGRRRRLMGFVKSFVRSVDPGRIRRAEAEVARALRVEGPHMGCGRERLTLERARDVGNGIAQS